MILINHYQSQTLTYFSISFIINFCITDSQPVGLVFGIPLAKCIANDNELRKRRAATKEKANDGDIVITRRDQRYDNVMMGFYVKILRLKIFQC